jgi:hypothetical protein
MLWDTLAWPQVAVADKTSRVAMARPASRALPAVAVPPPAPSFDAARFVRDHEVCWESAPSVAWHDGRRIPVGYDLTLFARHPQGLAADPSSPESRALRRGLTRVIERVCRAQGGALTCRVRDDPARLVLRRENDWAPEVELHLELLHPQATFGEADDGQKQGLRALEARLRELGVEWRAPTRRARRTVMG